MSVETVAVTDHVPVPWTKKINPIWWFKSGDTWTAPLVNNGAPYLPEITNQLARNVLWWLRNPMANFVGYVIGVEDRNYTVTGEAPALATTGRDCSPVQEGWRMSTINLGWLKLPFVSYYRVGVVEFYLGWRPASGGFGLKIVRG